MKQFECVVPILMVADVSRSTDYYVTKLGFKVDWEHRDRDYVISGVSRDGCPIYLCEGTVSKPNSRIWIGVEDVDQLYSEYSVSGAIIVKTPTNYSWAREMHVLDPDGHLLRMASDPPTAGA